MASQHENKNKNKNMAEPIWSTHGVGPLAAGEDRPVLSASTEDDTGSAWEFRRVAIVGAGAMGTSLAAILGKVVPVVLVCRNPDRAMQVFRDGVRTTGLLEATARPVVVQSMADILSVGGASAIFVATKTSAIAQIAADLKPILPEMADHPGGVCVVSYQNGIETGRQLLAQLDHPQVLRMVLAFGAIMNRQTGIVNVTLNHPPHSIGTIDPAYINRCKAIAKALSQGGMETVYDKNIEQSVWEKGILNASANPVAALVNASVGEILASPAKTIVAGLLKEGVSVAQAEGLALGEDYLARCWRFLEQAHAHIPSMVDDIRSGRETEVGQLNRQIINHGKRLGIPTPTHDVIDALIETFDWKVYRQHQHQHQQESSVQSRPYTGS